MDDISISDDELRIPLESKPEDSSRVLCSTVIEHGVSFEIDVISGNLLLIEIFNPKSLMRSGLWCDGREVIYDDEKDALYIHLDTGLTESRYNVARSNPLCTVHLFRNRKGNLVKVEILGFKKIIDYEF